MCESPIWFETRMDGIHVAFLGYHNWYFLPKIASSLGLGISYVFHSGRVRMNLRGEYSEWEVPLPTAQKTLNRFLKAARNARSLEIRVGRPALDYSLLSKFKRVSKLSLFAPTNSALDLGLLASLEALVLADSSLKKVQGIDRLTKMKVLHAQSTSSSLIASAPKSLKSLYIYGKLPIGLNVGHLENLETLVLENCRELDLSELSLGNAPLVVRLVNVRALKNLGHAKKTFAIAREIICEEMDHNLFEALKTNVPKHCRVTHIL